MVERPAAHLHGGSRVLCYGLDGCIGSRLSSEQRDADGSVPRVSRCAAPPAVASCVCSMGWCQPVTPSKGCGLMRFDAHWLAARGEGPSSTCRPRPGGPAPGRRGTSRGAQAPTAAQLCTGCCVPDAAVGRGPPRRVRDTVSTHARVGLGGLAPGEREGASRTTSNPMQLNCNQPS